MLNCGTFPKSLNVVSKLNRNKARNVSTCWRQWGRKLPVNLIHAGGRWWMYCKQQMKLHTIMGSGGQGYWPTVSCVLSYLTYRKEKSYVVMVKFPLVLKWFYSGSVELNTFAFQGNEIPPSHCPVYPATPCSLPLAHHIRSSTFLAWTFLSFVFTFALPTPTFGLSLLHPPASLCFAFHGGGGGR